MSWPHNRLTGYFAVEDASLRQGCLSSLAFPGTFAAKAARMILPPDPRYPLGKYRPELVARIRRELQLGTYETPEKLEIAIERMLASVEAALDDDERWRG